MKIIQILCRENFKWKGEFTHITPRTCGSEDAKITANPQSLKIPIGQQIAQSAKKSQSEKRKGDQLSFHLIQVSFAPSLQVLSDSYFFHLVFAVANLVDIVRN